uniref:Ran gtpase-activating protein n=1 Tax=Syphacia muris TaxID=451379 RepID=A0A0N5ALT5_9BILA
MGLLSEVNGEWILSFLDEQHKWDSIAEEPSLAIETAEIIHALEFRGNTLGIDAGKRISKALEKHPELKRALWSDMFTGRMKSEIPPVLRSLCDSMMSVAVNLVELDLSDNAFGPIGAEGIEHFLQSPSAYSLQVLKLNNNGLGAGGKVIARALKNCCINAKRDGRKFCLRSFIAGRNRLEMPGAIALADAFKEIGTLEEINMHQNGINASGIEALADSFKNNLSLRIINLSDNTFTSVGAKAIAKCLKMVAISYANNWYLTKLEVLHFGDCLCRNSGTVALMESIHPTVHSKLKEINLSGNELGPPIIEKILEKMAKDFSLDSLVLHTNNLGERFLGVKSRYTRHTFVDLGEESDDQGSLDDVEDGEVTDNDDRDEYTEESKECVENGHSQAELRNVIMVWHFTVFILLHLLPFIIGLYLCLTFP